MDLLNIVGRTAVHSQDVSEKAFLRARERCWERGAGGSRLLWLGLWGSEDVGPASSSAREVSSDLEKSTYSRRFLAVRIADQIISIILFLPTFCLICLASKPFQGPSAWGPRSRQGNTNNLGKIILWLSELLSLPFWLRSASGVHEKIFRLLCFYFGLRPRSYHVKMPQLMHSRMW